MKQISLTQEFINAYKGIENKFEEKTGINPMLISSQAAISGDYLREDYLLKNGKTIGEMQTNYER